MRLAGMNRLRDLSARRRLSAQSLAGYSCVRPEESGGQRVVFAKPDMLPTSQRAFLCGPTTLLLRCKRGTRASHVSQPGIHRLAFKRKYAE